MRQADRHKLRRITTPKRNLSSRDGDDDGADYQRALDRIHKRAVERATNNRLTAIGDRIIAA